jgi:trehalose-phosphatase
MSVDLQIPARGSASSVSSVENLRQFDSGWVSLVDQTDSSWRSTIEPLFQHYYERTPGSFIEMKEMNLTWHYRNADPEFGIWQATELQVNLEKILAHLAVSVLFFD